MKLLKILPVLGISVTPLLPISAQTADIEQMHTENYVIARFDSNRNTDRWKVEDDVVMGGRSQGNFTTDVDGYGKFFGRVSLENNGGFSSIQYNFKAIDVAEYEKAYIRLKGDGKRYQFRVKSSRSERASYVHEFETNGNWQTIEVPLRQMHPTFRGNRLNIPDYPGERMAQLRFLIGNGKAESFELKIDQIWLK